MTAVATQNSVVEAVKERTKITLTDANALFILDSDGILACEKSNNGKVVTPIGYLEQELLIEQLTSNRPVNTGILPKNTIFYEKFKGAKHTYNIYIMELDPRIIAIRQLFGSHSAGEVDTFNLAMPYIQFAVAIKELGGGQFATTGYSYVSVSNKPITSINDMVYPLPLNNVGSDCGICWGDGSLPKTTNDTIPSYVRKIPSAFFSVLFNNHLYPQWPKEFIEDYTGGGTTATIKHALTKWRDKSKADPLFILQTKFIGAMSLSNIYSYLKNSCRET